MIIKKAELETVCGITSKFPNNKEPEIVFAGKSNVGKSSLINALMNRKSLARTSGKPGKTQTINYYKVNDELYFVDLPGYGYTEYESIPSYKTWIETGIHIVRQELLHSKKLFVLGLSAGGMLAYNIACLAHGVSGVIVTTLLDNRLKPVRNYSAKNKLQARIALPLLRFIPNQMRRLKIPVQAVTNMKAIVNNDRVLSLLLHDKRGSGSSVHLGLLCSMMKSIPAVEPETFEIPLLLCHPEKDRWTPEWISRLFFDRIRSPKELCTLKNAGHFPIEQPGIAQLEEAIISFINKTLQER